MIREEGMEALGVFFQAEDGIRDIGVTGVQTCALPISPKGQRPIALGHHRYKWLYVTAFVQPISGETFWYISNGISKPFFAALLALFAREAGAGRVRIVVLGLDNAGWHTEPNLAVPDGIRLVYLPRYSPELQRSGERRVGKECRSR